MKKLILSALALTLGLSMSAQFAFYLPNGCSYDASTEAVQGYDRPEKTDGINQDPEYNAAIWFRDNYVKNGKGKFITSDEFQVASNRADITVLWIHIDRYETTEKARHEYQIEQGITENFRAALKTFVTTEGKNLLLSKQACHILGNLLRSRAQNGTDILWPEYPIGGYDKNREQWFIATHFANRSNTDHAIYAKHQEETLSPNAPGNIETLWMRDGDDDTPHHMTDHNCGLTPANLGMTGNDDYTNMKAWESKNNARIIGTWGNCTDMPYAGMIEFMPKKWDNDNDFQGTILMFGLATYTWVSNNGGYGKENIRHITNSALNYLFSKHDYTRNVNVGDYGTLCLPYKATVTGAVLFNIIDKDGDDTNINSITIQELESNEAEAGTPYIFRATENTLTATMSGAYSDTKANNGLLGTYNRIRVENGINCSYVLAKENDETVLRHVAADATNVHLNPYRAFVVTDQIVPATPAPGRPVVVIGKNPIVTGVEEATAAKATKALVNGKLVIVRGNKTYDVNGKML